MSHKVPKVLQISEEAALKAVSVFRSPSQILEADIQALTFSAKALSAVPGPRSSTRMERMCLWILWNMKTSNLTHSYP